MGKRKWLTAENAVIAGVTCLAASLLIFGAPKAAIAPLIALFVVGVIAHAFSPRLLFPHAWPSFHLTASAVAYAVLGAGVAVPLALVSAVIASVLHANLDQKRSSWKRHLAYGCGPSVRALAGAASASFIAPQLVASQVETTSILFFCAGWYLLVFVQIAAVDTPVRNADLDSRITSFGVMVLDGFSNLLASLTVVSVFTPTEWAPVLFLLMPIFAIYAMSAHEARSEKKLWEGVVTLHRMLSPSHPSSIRHMQRVAEYGRRTAVQLGFSASQAELVNVAALVHDIGKIAIDEEVLEKPTKLNTDEMNHVRTHAQIGSEILATVPAYLPIAKWVRHHHERVDGGGYPDGLLGESIPLESRIIAVVDAYDAMVGGPEPSDKRPYRDAITPADALAELRRCSGTQFDPAVVEAFCRITEEGEEVEL